MNERKGKKKGQVVVELLLILPVFLSIVFTIMEMGNIAFQMIVLNHATFEVARIGAMTRVTGTLEQPSISKTCDDLRPLMNKIIHGAEVKCDAEDTFRDRQAEFMNQDLIVTGSYRVRLIFPISSVLLSKPSGTGRRLISAVVRMPIERPLQK